MNLKVGPFIKNVVITTVLGLTFVWLTRHASDPIQGPTVADTSGPVSLPAPALPVNFPTVQSADIDGLAGSGVSLAEAFKACWPHLDVDDIPADGEISTLEAENLFGKIKRREVFEQGKTRRIGLIFDDSRFPAGAAGSVMEPSANIGAQKSTRWSSFHFRAAGRMLHCENPNQCECL